MAESNTQRTKYSHEFDKFFNFTRMFSKLCGIDVVSEDYRMTWMTWSLIGLVNGAIAFTFYTVYEAITVRSDWIDVIKCLCMFCTGIQAYTKLINALKRPDMMCRLYKEILSIYVVYEKKSKNYHQLLKRSLKLTKKLILILVSIVIFTFVAVIGIPILYELAYDERIFVMPFFLPYVDYESNFGYFFTSAFHAVCVFFGAVGNFINDCWCFIFASHIPLIKNILQLKFKELDAMLLADADKEESEIRDSLLHILKWHQKYIEFEKFFNFTRVFAKLCGVDLVSEDYRMTWMTWSLIGLVNGAIAFTFYTFYEAIAIRNDWTDVVKCLCMFCTGIQAYAKLLNGLKRTYMVSFIYEEIVNIYAVYEQKNRNYHVILDDSIKLVKKLVGILLGIIVLTCMAIIGVPVFYQIVFQERIFVMPFFLPYVDYESNSGYYFTSVFHAVCVLFGLVGNFINDCWCFIFAAHIPLIKNILELKFKELDEILLAAAGNEEEKIRDLLLDIFRWHQKYKEFCKTVKVLFFWVIFVQVAMEFVSIVCTIVCMFLGVWPAAPVFLIYSFALFYFHCALGNIVEISNDDVISMIYDSCWYNLNVSQQKMIVIMLRESQQAEGMSIGGIAPLSLHTALQLTKTIYTFSMMLKQFLD